MGNQFRICRHYGIAMARIGRITIEDVSLSKVKNSKAIPLQTLTGLEGSRRLRLPHSKTVGT
jgi:hypothetical protein